LKGISLGSRSRQTSLLASLVSRSPGASPRPLGIGSPGRGSSNSPRDVGAGRFEVGVLCLHDWRVQRHSVI